jgi:hypothetical protein
LLTVRLRMPRPQPLTHRSLMAAARVPLIPMATHLPRTRPLQPPRRLLPRMAT